MVYKYGNDGLHNSSLAEDLVQQTIMNALTSQREGRGFTAPLDEPYQQSLMHWLYTIQRHQFLTNIRRRKERLHTSLVTDDDQTEGCLNLFPVRERQEDLLETKQVWEAIDRLPFEQRDALIRVSIHGESNDDLAKNQGIALGTAKSRVFRAREHLRQAFGRPRQNTEEPSVLSFGHSRKVKRHSGSKRPQFW